MSMMADPTDDSMRFMTGIRLWHRQMCSWEAQCLGIRSPEAGHMTGKGTFPIIVHDAPLLHRNLHVVPPASARSA
jgi:hypothetical protein